MDLLTFQGQPEQDSFKARFTAPLRALGYKGFYIGAMATVGASKTEWFWTDSNYISPLKKISYPINWMVSPSQPDNFYGREYCMNIYIRSATEFSYNDIQCSENYGTHTQDPEDAIFFVCEDIIYNVQP